MFTTFPTFADIPKDFVSQFPKGNLKRTKWTRRIWLAWFGDTCPSCGDNFNLFNPIDDKAMTVDHLLARALGGSNDWHNLSCICRECNQHKSTYEHILAKTLKQGIK